MWTVCLEIKCSAVICTVISLNMNSTSGSGLVLGMFECGLNIGASLHGVAFVIWSVYTFLKWDACKCSCLGCWTIQFFLGSVGQFFHWFSWSVQIFLSVCLWIWQLFSSDMNNVLVEIVDVFLKKYLQPWWKWWLTTGRLSCGFDLSSKHLTEKLSVFFSSW